MQISRLFGIVYMLLDKKIVTAKELADHFAVSARTILRDIDHLSSAGIPIYTTQGKGGGISLMEHFVLNKSVISEEEQNEILFALKSIGAVNGIDADSTLTKLQSLFQKRNADWISIDFSDWGASPTRRQYFNLLKQAVLKKQVVAFDYVNRLGQRGRREVEPLRIIFKSYTWYLQGFCREKQDYRTYKLTRMKDLAVREESFERKMPPELPLEEWNTEGSFYTCLELKFSSEMGCRVYEEFEEDHIVKNDDGTYTVVIDYLYDSWVMGHLLSFGEHVEVIKPDFIRKEIARKAENIHKKYQKKEKEIEEAGAFPDFEKMGERKKNGEKIQRAVSGRRSGI